VSTTWADVGLKIAENIDQASKLIEALGKLWDEIKRIIGDVNASNLRNSLLALLVEMSKVNYRKLTAGELLDNYCRKPDGQVKWTDVQNHARDIANLLDPVQKNVEDKAMDIIKASNLALKDDLSAALQKQSEAYRILADAPEPQPGPQMDQVKEIAAKLKQLLTKVRELEGNLIKSP
jgi:hypothetical protein